MATERTSSDQELEIFDVLCGKTNVQEVLGGEIEMTTALRSELAALQYKRDSLLMQLQETRTQLRIKDDKALQLESEIEQLKEQAARQTAVIASLTKRLHELEERERSLSGVHTRTEMALNTLQREKKYSDDRAYELTRKVERLELELNQEEQRRVQTQNNLTDLMSRLESTMGSAQAGSGVEQGAIGSHLIQDAGRMRTRLEESLRSLSSLEDELTTCRSALARATADKESIHRQLTAANMEIDRLRQEKDNLESQQRAYERELIQLREELAQLTRKLNLSSEDVQMHASTITSLQDELKQKEERCLRAETELSHLLESLAIVLSSPQYFVEANQTSIKQALKRLTTDHSAKSTLVDSLEQKCVRLVEESARLEERRRANETTIKRLHDEAEALDTRLRSLEADLNNAIVAKEALRRDKAIFVTFLERLARCLNMDDISREVGVELHTESILLRAQQLARLESDKLIDKWLYYGGGTYPGPALRRYKSQYDLSPILPPLYRETAVVSQLQRRVRCLRDQLQRRDLHIDLLRRKLALQEESSRTKSLLQAERDEANLKIRKHLKQIDRLQSQLNEARALSRDLKLQLTEASDYKLSSMERGRRLDELQKRLVDSESLRTRATQKLAVIKEQLRVNSDGLSEARTSVDQLRTELGRTREELAAAQRQKQTFARLRSEVCSALRLPDCCHDYEIISKLNRVWQEHCEYQAVSARHTDLPCAGTSPRRTTSVRANDLLLIDTEEDDLVDSMYNRRSDC